MNYFVFIVFLTSLAVNGQSQVCYNQQVSYRAVSRVAYRQGTQSYTSSHSCGFLNWQRCRRTFYRSTEQSFIAYQRVGTYSTVSQCCTGYVGTPPNCKAQCTGGCQNGGTCTSPDVCTCVPGWTGSDCGTDVNECLTDNGGCTQTCNNIDGSYQCSCQDGYQLDNDNHTCIDIEECVTDTHNCSQLCVEMHGGYECDCSNGYELEDNGVTCQDIDECDQGSSGCSQGCRNTDGSFICTCDEGYQMHHDDPKFCVDIDECTNSNGGCHHDCKNTVGSYHCLCQSGYILGANGHSCQDVNECSDSNGGCQHNCTNTIGSYYCSCAAGYSLDDDNNHRCSSVVAIDDGKVSEVSDNNNSSNNSAGPIAGSVVAVLVLVIVLAVVIGCVLIRYKKKHNPSSVAATRVLNNATAIAAAEKEKELNEDAFDNLTYNVLKQNDYCNEHKDHTPAVSQDYEVPYDNVQY